MTDDNDSDANENENDRTDESWCPSSPETPSPSNISSDTPTYKSTSFTHTDTIETSFKYQPHSLRLEKESTIIQRKKTERKQRCTWPAKWMQRGQDKVYNRTESESSASKIPSSHDPFSECSDFSMSMKLSCPRGTTSKDSRDSRPSNHSGCKVAPCSR